MGGNALKKVQVVRKNKIDYEKIKQEICDKINNILTYHTISEVPNKETFGDLDILYLYNPKINIREIIIELFKPNEIVTNGDVISFDYNNFQIDFIQCENLDMAKFYFSYGDLGSIIGRIANYYGIKFGHNGLWINLLENTYDSSITIDNRNIIGKIILSNNPTIICDFFSYDYKKWETGFNSINEIFDWIVNSKYFKKDIFLILNSEHRSRLKLRPMYLKFINYLEININNIEKANLKSAEIKINLQDYSIDYFNKKLDVDTIIKNNKIKKERKEKFNGKTFIDIGIKPKFINIYMEKFKEYIENKFLISFEDWIDSASKEDINEIVYTFYDLNVAIIPPIEDKIQSPATIQAAASSNPQVSLIINEIHDIDIKAEQEYETKYV